MTFKQKVLYNDFKLIIRRKYSKKKNGAIVYNKKINKYDLGYGLLTFNGGNFMKKFFVLFAILAITLTVTAQNKYSVLTGKITVKGTGTPGVTLVLTGPKIMGQRTVVTDANGVFRFALLPPGDSYEFKATLEGFQPFVRKNITLTLGNNTTINFEMQESNVTEEIVVTAEAPLIDTKSSQSSTNLSSEFIQSIANDRQYQMIMAMMPGTVEGNNPSMLGGASTDNVYLVDGADTTDPSTHTWGAAMNFDTIDEIQLVTTGISAEHGRAQGAVANMVTKSGGNEFHGNFRYVASRISWNSPDDGKKFDEAVKYTEEDRISFTVGGPIIKDKLWFFASYETRSKVKQTFHYPTIQDWWTQDQSNLSSDSTKYAGHYLSFKLTYQLNENHHFMVMYQEDPIDFPLYAYYNYDYYQDPTQVERQQGGERIFFEWNWVVSDDSYLTFKYQNNDGPLSNLPGDGTSSTQDKPVMRYYGGSGIGSYYPSDWAPQAYYDSKRTFDSFNVQYSKFMDTAYGSHDLKLGTEFRKSEYGDTTKIYNGGQYMLWREDYWSYFYKYDDSNVLPTTTKEDYTAFYLQDDWSVSDKLTVNIGLRTEELILKNHNDLKIVENSYGDMISPRIGFSYDLDGDKIYASVARYYDAIGDWVVNNNQPSQLYTRQTYWFNYFVETVDANGDGITDDSYVDVNGQLLRPWLNQNEWMMINDFTDTNLWELGSLSTYGTPDSEIKQYGSIKASFMDEYTIGFEKQVGTLYALGAKYVNREWQDAYEDADLEQDGSWNFVTVDGTWRKYNAFILTAQKKLSDDGFQFLFSYTHSKTEGISAADNSTVYLDSPYDVFNWFGRVNDYPDVFKFNGSYAFDFGLSLGFNYINSSGVSYTPSLEFVDIIPSSINAGYWTSAWAEKRGSRHMPSWSRADLHIEYMFNVYEDVKISVYADIFNVFNTRDILGINTLMGEGEYVGAPNPDVDEAGYIEFVQTHAPTLVGEVYDNFEQAEWYSAPRSYFLGFNVKF